MGDMKGAFKSFMTNEQATKIRLKKIGFTNRQTEELIKFIKKQPRLGEKWLLQKNKSNTPVMKPKL